MEENLLEIIKKLLNYDKIIFEKDNQSFMITKVNNLVNLKVCEDTFEKNKITTKLLSSNNYEINELVNVIESLNLENYIREKYNELLQREEKISEEKSKFMAYLYDYNMSVEDKDLLYNIMYIVSYNGFINIGTDYGLTFMSPFNKDIKLYLINLKTGENVTNYDEIIKIVTDLYHKNRVKFTNNVVNNNDLNEKFNIKR